MRLSCSLDNAALPYRGSIFLASLPEIFDAKYEEVMQALDPEMTALTSL